MSSDAIFASLPQYFYHTINWHHCVPFEALPVVFRYLIANALEILQSYTKPSICEFCNQLNLAVAVDVIKSPRSGVTLCFQFVSAASASVAAKTFPSHVKTGCETVDIWHRDYMGLGKCTGWPFPDLDPRSRLWRWLAKICLSVR